MGRRANYDIKEKRGPGRKAKKQGAVTMKLFEAKNFNIETPNSKLNSSLKRFVS